MADLQKVVDRLRNRRLSIASWATLSALCALALVFCFYSLSQMRPVPLEADIFAPITRNDLFWTHLELSGQLHLSAVLLFSCACLGIALAMLSQRMLGTSKDDLILQMWDRITDLEARQAALPNPSDGSDAATPSEGDVSKNE